MRETISSVIGRTSRAGRTKRSKAQRSRQTSSGVVRTRPGQNRLLLVVDESPSSKAAVDYVAKVLGHRRGFQVCLAAATATHLDGVRRCRESR
jgi:hypothetical protein